MSLGLSIAPVVDRIRDQVTALKLVAGAAELASAIDGSTGIQSPSAYVVLAREDAASHAGGAGHLVQSVNVALGVTLCVRNYARADLGGAAGTDLESIRASVRGALLNWMHPDAELVFDLQSGSVYQYDKGTLWWQDVFRSRYRIEVNS